MPLLLKELPNLDGTITITGNPNVQANVLVIQDNALNPRVNGQLIMVFDHLGNPIWSIPNAGGPCVFGDQSRAGSSVFGPFISFDASVNPPCIRTTNAVNVTQGRMWLQAGAPTATLSAVACVANQDFYLRTDTVSTVNQRMYVCTASGTPGTWTGIL